MSPLVWLIFICLLLKPYLKSWPTRYYSLRDFLIQLFVRCLERHPNFTVMLVLLLIHHFLEHSCRYRTVYRLVCHKGFRLRLLRHTRRLCKRFVMLFNNVVCEFWNAAWTLFCTTDRISAFILSWVFTCCTTDTKIPYVLLQECTPIGHYNWPYYIYIHPLPVNTKRNAGK